MILTNTLLKLAKSRNFDLPLDWRLLNYFSSISPSEAAYLKNKLAESAQKLRFIMWQIQNLREEEKTDSKLDTFESSLSQLIKDHDLLKNRVWYFARKRLVLRAIVCLVVSLTLAVVFDVSLD